MSLEVGSRLGHYDVTALIGEGGMGQVYRATDTKLKRQVALKILPEAFSADPERLARFQREAEVLASLNHPNIAAIYGLEEAGDTRALVLELVEGPTLADRIKKGPIPLDEALPIAKQIAEALEAAHEAGVIHRDLKPANIKVRDDGTVKVLDFGLAKALDPNPTGDPSQSPTLTAAATQMGVIMGTAAYMSPEQARGKPVDKRADVWAFGAVLFEMLTGKKAFPGDDLTDTIAAVVRGEPAWDAMPEEVPERLTHVMRACLQKDQSQRIRDVGDASLAMAGTFETTEAVRSGKPPGAPTWRQALAIAAGALVVGTVVTGVTVWRLTPGLSPPTRLIRSSIVLPADVSVGDSLHNHIDFSPDGTRLVYAGSRQLYLRVMDQAEATPIRGTEGATEPFFSPDSQWIAFWADGQLKKVSVAGGTPSVLCPVAVPPFGATWAADEAILFNQFQVGVWRVPGTGGTPELIAPVDAEVGGFVRPQLLPGGEWILFSAAPDRKIAVQSLVTGERKILIENGGDVKYLPTGHLAYVRDGTLWAVPFDAEAQVITGGAVSLIEGVRQAENNGLARFAHAQDGTLVYERGGSQIVEPRTLAWVGRDGQEEPIQITPRPYTRPRVSPDGTRVVVATDGPESELFVYDLETEVEEQFTFYPRHDLWPLWSQDGSQIVFTSTRDGGQLNLYVKAADGSGAAERLTTGSGPNQAMDWADGGATILFGGSSFTGPRRGGLKGLRLDAEAEPEVLLEAEANETAYALSPNGRWIAYDSDVSGEHRVYVRPFPEVGGGGQRLISDGPGHAPLWHPNGSELFYLTADAVVSAAVKTGDSFERGVLRRLFSAEPYRQGFGSNWDISHDGQKFLMVKSAEAAGEHAAPIEIIVVQNWFRELNDRVPVD